MGKDYDRVLDALFQVRRNERVRFNRRNQQRGETSKEYIMALYSLAKNCDHGNDRRDDTKPSSCWHPRLLTLQMDPTLTLATAEKAVRQREAVHEQQRSPDGQ